MFVPKRPELIGKIQTRSETPETATYQNIGEIALWEHNGKYLLRGYVTIGKTKYLVSLHTNGA